MMMRATMSRAEGFLTEVDRYSAHNYHPLPVVLEGGEGSWVWDVDGKRYLDMLSAYSALNQGHRHPLIIGAALAQMQKLTLTSRAFHNDQMGPFLNMLCEVTGFEKALPMNTGAEAVETAIKMVRKWGYKVKGVPEDRAEIIVCDNNFHGRTTTTVVGSLGLRPCSAQTSSCASHNVVLPLRNRIVRSARACKWPVLLDSPKRVVYSLTRQ